MHARRVGIALLGLFVAGALLGSARSPVGRAASPGQVTSPWRALRFCTERVSVSSAGEQGSREASSVSLSDDGHLVAFCSDAPNLVPGDDNGKYDNFVRDRVTGTTTRVTFAHHGETYTLGDDDIFLSGDGSTIAFQSRATLTGPSGAMLCAAGGYVESRECIVVRDLRTGVFEVADVRPDGRRGNGHSRWPALSADGGFVAFWSTDSDLVPGDLNHASDVFARDRRTGLTERASVDDMGVEGSARSGEIGVVGADAVAISRDGRYVAFGSQADDLVPDDGDTWLDVFVRDLVAGTTRRVSAAPGSPGTGHSVLGARQAISDDGRYVVFASDADHLVPGDTNGAMDVFVRDLHGGTMTRVSIDSGGGQSRAPSGPIAAISADGRFVAFTSWSDLVPDDTNGTRDIFVRDLVAGVTVRASVAAGGAEANGDNGSQIWHGLSISADGLTVAWASQATNLVPGDTNAVRDVFVRAPCADQATATPTPTTAVPTPSPTGTPTAPPTATATSTPTSTPTSCPTPISMGSATPTAAATDAGTRVCPHLFRRVPSQVISDALANPHGYAGFGLPCNPNLPVGPWNPMRRTLALQNPARPYHPIFNTVVWKCGCP